MYAPILLSFMDKKLILKYYSIILLILPECLPPYDKWIIFRLLRKILIIWSAIHLI